MSGLYRTIVADPPWALEWNANVGKGRSGRKGLPYPTMSLEDICGLPVAGRTASVILESPWTGADVRDNG